MLGPFDYLVWLLGFLIEAYVVLRALSRHNFLKYSSLNLYMLATALTTLAEFYILRTFGFRSMEYRFFYYYSDCLLTVMLYLTIMGLYGHVFKQMGASRYVRLATILLLAATMAFSYLVVRQNQRNLTGRFVFELAQNLYFVGVVLTYLLWGAVMKLRETRVRLIQLVLALGVYFSASAALYALRNLFPGVELLGMIQPIVNLWLPAAWAYTFTTASEETRLATARLAAQ